MESMIHYMVYLSREKYALNKYFLVQQINNKPDEVIITWRLATKESINTDPLNGMIKQSICLLTLKVD